VRICVVTPLYALAGVPLAQVRFARALASKNHDVDLVIGHVSPGYELPEMRDISVRNLNRMQVRAMFFPLLRYLRTVRPDVVFSAEDHLNSIVLLAAIISRSKARISCSSRVTPFDTYSNVPLTKRWFLKHLMNAVMWRADALTCVSRDMVDQYKRVLGSSSHVCVYNIVDDGESLSRMHEEIEHEWLLSKKNPVVVAAGRLAAWKGFADLIRAIKLVSSKRPVRLIILGDGPDRSKLEALVLSLGLSDVIRLEGYVDNPLKYFARADVFVLSSHVEGLPNVLVEAMMCGCTPVSTDCPTGPREVLQDGKFGYLVPVRDPEAMAHAIETALENPIPKDVLARAVAPFNTAAVLSKHFEVLGFSSRP
jgi:glycosyltransferase involved in cell wall biosynthesis